LISTRSTGFDHIDLKECSERNITVCNVPFYGENTVAEHTFALILALSRNIHKTYVRTIINNFSLEGLRGFDLKGKTIGIVGAGHIGLHVIRMAKGFGMNALAFDLRRDNFLSEVLGFEYCTPEDLFRRSDIVSLHAPLNEHTKHMINRSTFRTFKKGSVLINTSRGGLIDTEALIEALDSGILCGAGLDVLEGEELLKEEKQLLHDKLKQDTIKGLILSQNLLSRENVVYTPHNAFNSHESVMRILETSLQNITSFQAGKPENVVK
jgi:D-lactate dehydrogenase